ncbi:hypothetical protein DEA8626_00572 [Defluviimonas aquaemixtae]|uniref:Uncharacterized protein n=1 Tax=Albidovulum aquaemixtae TaxID=1542388 RepID=A0A2R8B376_9RHOB|nr:hypothetical protein [Defluviimonas aquaemixtae]SPH17058.1 hypothetical protein DEA8626_00572 [Defluviimonas aquaemixtae]
MTAIMENNDFIGRLRRKLGTDAGKTKPEGPARRFIVQVTRDGRDVQRLVFDHPPSIGAIAARVGTEPYVVSVEVMEMGAAGTIAAE